jgi:hypothetical protein
MQGDVAPNRVETMNDRRLGWLALLLGVVASLVLVGDAAAERFSPLAGGFAGLLVALGLVVLARARFQGKAPSAAASWLTAIAAGGWIGTRCHDLVLLQFASGHTEVLEYLEGLDLEQLVERFGPQPVGRTVHVLTQVCESLQEAHTRGVVHRDIKASNIFLCQLGSSYDFVKVLDFGLVRPSLSGRDAARAIGTPAYMAPEIAVEGASVDGRADIYSLGCVAYWMLTGTEVFPGDDPVGVVAAHIGSEPAPPSQRTEVEIPESVDRLILRCLAKKPEDRFPDAEGLAAALQRCVCEGAWGPEQAREWWRLHAPDDGADLDVASRL